jgi:hypothetical protein
MKRVKRISMDVLVDDTVDGVDLADEIADAMEEMQFVVIGCGFDDDLTEDYEEHFPELLKR